MMDAIDQELRSTMVSAVKQQLEVARAAQKSAEESLNYVTSMLNESEAEVIKLEDQLKTERDAKAILEAKIVVLENRPVQTFPEPKEPDLAPLLAAIKAVAPAVIAELQTFKEAPEASPTEFDVVRGGDGRIMKIKVK